MSKKNSGKRCTECGAVGVPQAKELCKPCRLERDEGPEARRLYLQQIASKGAMASKAKRGQHALRVDALPALEDHGSVKVWLPHLAEGVASGQVSKGLSAEVRKVLKTWVKVHRQEVTDE